MARLLWALVVFLAVGANIAEAKPAPLAFIQFGAATDMPNGLAEMCRSNAPLCGRLAGPAGTIDRADPDPDKAWLKLLKRIDGTVNAHVRQQSDLRSYGVGELWRPSGSGRNAVGDCEDLAIEKRLQLLDAGFPPERLFFAVVYRSGLGLHTVLVARLDGGDMVLDSRSSFVERWQATGYQWLIAERPGTPTGWTAIS